MLIIKDRLGRTLVVICQKDIDERKPAVACGSGTATRYTYIGKRRVIGEVSMLGGNGDVWLNTLEIKAGQNVTIDNFFVHWE